MTEPELLLGDEAVALAALHEGVSGAYGYPGTPSTEILEYILPRAEKHGVKACWATNEKVAMELAVGMSFVGKKTIVTMKHVGLNVAMDPFMSASLTGTSGGMIFCIADDPGMHSSQNEQDSRSLARFALMPCFEPSNQQEAYDMTREAFQASERYKLPVMLRLVTRLAHSRSRVNTRPAIAQNPLKPISNRAAFTLLPANARTQFKKLTEMQSELETFSEKSKFNELNLTGKDKRRGIIASGVAFNYVAEAFDGKIPFPYLKLGVYPIPTNLVKQLFDAVDEVVVVEEGYPVIEEALRGILNTTSKPVRGKLDGTLPRTGELTPTIVSQGLGLPVEVASWPKPDHLPARPPMLCKGCPHADSFNAIKEAMNSSANGAIFGDIGCYTLGYYEPYNAIDACLEMGASIGMAVGASQAGAHPVFCTIGDSTFTHSGITSLITAVKQNANINLCILDNDITAMTGGQESSAVGENLVKLVLGAGLDEKHLRILNPMPKFKDENVQALKEEMAHQGLSVIIFKRACIQVKG